MKAYILRRVLLIPPTLLGISLLTFVMLQLMPGSPVANRLMAMQGAMAGDGVPQEIIEQTRRLYGLDKPLHVQYGLWVTRLVKLDFGESYKDRRPVLDKILEALPITIQLSVLSILITYLIAVPLGVFSATHQQTVSDTIVTVLLFILYSIPNFWLAMLLLYYFGGGPHFNWFPTHGINSLGAADFAWHRWMIDRLYHLVLPLTCLTLGSFAYLSRYARAGMIDVIRQDYIRTARAYGFSEKIVVFKYAMRNSLIPILTLMAALLPLLISGSVIIEQIFSIPGMGRLAFEAILSRDYPLVMGILTISAVLTLLGLLLSDILYAVTDPRIKFE